jgi:hypothetical protein
MQILGAVGSSEQLPTPTLTTSSEVGSFTATITNYSASNGYTVTASAGSVSRSGSLITVSGLGNSQSSTLTVFSTRVGFNNSANAVVTASAIPGCTYVGAGPQSIAGGNCGTCGIICCTSGVPAHIYCVDYYSPSVCNLNGTKLTAGSYTYICVGWHCCTTGTCAGLSCGPGSPCGGATGC